jgi:MFS family permease
VSFATDAATEAIYPLLPFFLTRVLGASPVSLGIVEGAAEAVNSGLKIVSGRLADRSPSKRRLVLAGYATSSIARPFIAITTSWLQVFTVRVLDRVGKGVRSAPRDALLAAWTTPTTRGKVYGFHRAMDHFGAVAGPILASAFLYFFPDQYRTLFALTIVPGAVAVALIFFVDEPSVPLTPAGPPSAGAAGREVSHGDAPLPREFTSFMIVLALFTLGNSTDAFLLLKLTDVAGSPRFVPAIWAALHVVKATVSIFGGSWSDRIGRRAVIALGWVVYAVVYAGFAISESLPALVVWFLIYGLYFGFAEGTEKALVADLAPPQRRGFAFGIYNAVTGLGSLAASIVFGLIWSRYGAAAAFSVGSVLALLSTALLFVVVRPARAT